MIMGASIASVAWVCFYPFAQMRRLKELEAQQQTSAED